MSNDARSVTGSLQNAHYSSLDLDALYDTRFSQEERQSKNGVWEKPARPGA